MNHLKLTILTTIFLLAYTHSNAQFKRWQIEASTHVQDPSLRQGDQVIQTTQGSLIVQPGRGGMQTANYSFALTYNHNAIFSSTLRYGTLKVGGKQNTEFISSNPSVVPNVPLQTSMHFGSSEFIGYEGRVNILPFIEKYITHKPVKANRKFNIWASTGLTYGFSNANRFDGHWGQYRSQIINNGTALAVSGSSTRLTTASQLYIPVELGVSYQLSPSWQIRASYFYQFHTTWLNKDGMFATNHTITTNNQIVAQSTTVGSGSINGVRLSLAYQFNFKKPVKKAAPSK
ncbi:MAG: hypothetical protein EAY72_09155 [Bacteroidetes bacterium]|nr:MAG: hypothetical protein EAY72_09155 [Bacteroidota bacterium]